jgi:predicted anti-sigma-YlaC factor YlaD
MVKQDSARRAGLPRAKLTCEQATALIRDYLAGELDPEIAATFEEHLRNCADCEAFLNTYKQTIHTVQSFNYDEIPAEVQSRVHQFLQAKLRGFPPRR